MARFVFHGKTLDELRSMDLSEFMQLLPSRERRTIRRGFTEREKKLVAKLKQSKSKDRFIRTHAREMIIVPEMIGMKFGVYNGKEFFPVEVKPEMVGHRLGEFSLSRRKVAHSSPGFGATRSSKFVPLK